MKWLRCLSVWTIALALSSCSGGSGKPRVAFVSNNPATFWSIAEVGTRKAAEQLGVECVFRKPASSDPAPQTEILDSLKNQDIKAIAVSVTNPAGQRDHLNELAARLPLLTVDNDAPDTQRLCYIGTNNYEAGRAVGKLVQEAMPDGGTIAIFVGHLDALNARQRRQGVLDELAGTPPPARLGDMQVTADGQPYGKYRLHRTYTDAPTGEEQATRNANQAITDLHTEKGLCLIGLWAYNPPAILTAVKDKIEQKVITPGQVKIVGFDEDFATLDGIAQGQIHGTVVQNPYEFGFQSVRVMASLARGDRSVLPADGLLIIPYRVVTRDGGPERIPVAQFRAEMEQLLKP